MMYIAYVAASMYWTIHYFEFSTLFQSLSLFLYTPRRLLFRGITHFNQSLSHCPRDLVGATIPVVRETSLQISPELLFRVVGRRLKLPLQLLLQLQPLKQV
jgi:hypothetical protein